MLSRYWTTNRCSAIGARSPINFRLYSEQKSLCNQAIIDFLKRCTFPLYPMLSSELSICPGQKEEEAMPTANSYKVTTYKRAIRSIQEVQQPIRLGTDVLQVCRIKSCLQLSRIHCLSFQA